MKNKILNHKKINKLRQQILSSRENTYGKIKSYIQEIIHASVSEKKNSCFILVSLNIKGFPKNNLKFLQSLKYFIDFVESCFSLYKIKRYKLFTGLNGFILLIVIEESPIIAKYLFYNLEKNWRFLDIDIFFNNKMISSSLIELEKKKCIICNNFFDFCRFKNRHTIRQLRKKTISLINKFCENYLLCFDK